MRTLGGALMLLISREYMTSEQFWTMAGMLLVAGVVCGLLEGDDL